MEFTPAGLLWWKYSLCLSFSPHFCFVFQHFCFGLCVFTLLKTSYHNKSTTSFFSFMQRVPMLLLLLWQQMFFLFFFPLGSACIQSKWDLCRDSSGSTYCIQFIPSRQHSLFIQQAWEKFLTTAWDDIKNWSSRVFEEVDWSMLCKELWGS